MRTITGLMAERGPQDAAVSHNSDAQKPEMEVEKQVPAREGFFSRRNLLGPVRKDHGDLALLAHSLATGMVDAASFSNWGVFCGMQTGRSSFHVLFP